MTDAFRFHLSQFISPGHHVPIKEALGRVPYFPDHLTACIIAGPARCGKTSILFHYALNMTASGKTVIIICIKDRMENTTLLLPEDTSPALLERIQIKYISTGEELRRYAAAFHLLGEPPDALLLDDLSSYISDHDRRGYEMEVVKTVALLSEAVRHAQEQRRGTPTMLVATELAAAEKPRSTYLTQRWFPLTLTIRSINRSYLMQAQQNLAREHGANAMCLSQLQYSMAGHLTLHLEAVLPP
eukprot:jgi/Botrbrau1/2734/Bobra.0164s0014.1